MVKKSSSEDSVLEYKNLTIIGTSHIARESYKMVERFIEDDKPDIVALELDSQRLAALLSKENKGQKSRYSLSQIRQLGLKGFLFTLIGSYVQRKLGRQVGVSPGSEMKVAIASAKKINTKVALIDQHIVITMRNFSKSFTWKDRWNFLADFFKGIFMRKKQMRELGIENMDLSKVPEGKLVKKLISQMKKRYPGIYKSLIRDRNHVMAKRLAFLMDKHPDQNILAVVGAGHMEDILKLIKTKYIKTSTT